MNTIKLKINRENSIFGCAVPYTIYINDKEIAQLPNGRLITTDVPGNEKFYLAVSTSGKQGSVFQKITPHSSMTLKKVLIHPEYCKNGTVTCNIITKANILGAVSFGFLRPGTDLDIHVDYD